MAGCDAAYVIAPNMHPDEPAYVASALGRAAGAGVERVVYHSVASPYAPAMPHHVGKAAAEDLVRRSGLGWTILQPGAYLQNLDLTGPVDRLPPDAPFGFLDLDDLGWRPRPCSPSPATTARRTSWPRGGRRSRTLAAEAGVDVEVVTPMQWAATDAADLDERVRAWLLAMFTYYDAHGLPVGTLPLRTLLGR